MHSRGAIYEIIIKRNDLHKNWLESTCYTNCVSQSLLKLWHTSTWATAFFLSSTLSLVTTGIIHINSYPSNRSLNLCDEISLNHPAWVWSSAVIMADKRETHAPAIISHTEIEVVKWASSLGDCS
jgi:hypothetical protein